MGRNHGFAQGAEPARAALWESAAANGITDAGCDRFAPVIDLFRFHPR